MKLVYPDTGIFSKAMYFMNSFVNDVFERIVSEASRLKHYSKRSTINSREVQTAVRHLIGELVKYAMSKLSPNTQAPSKDLKKISRKIDR